MIIDHRASTLLIAGIAAITSAACPPDVPHSGQVPTLSIENLSRTIEDYRGRIVRVCGRIAAPDAGQTLSIEHIQQPGQFFVEGLPRILIVAQSIDDLRLDSKGCLSGKIARRDQSTSLYVGDTAIVENAPYSEEWFLHPQ